MSKTSPQKPPRLVDSKLMHLGAEYRLPEWLEPGQSFFLPTLKSEYLAKEVKARYERRGMRMRSQERIEAGYLGIRVWRVL